MKAAFLPLLLLWAALGALAQTQVDSAAAPGYHRIQLYSFGYSLAPSDPHLDLIAHSLSPGPFTVQGLECPYCTILPLASRTRFVLDPVGEAFIYRPSQRLQVSNVFDIAQPLLPDYIGMKGIMTRSGFRLMEGSKLASSETSVSFSPDRNRRVWVGTSLRLLQQLNALGGKGWKTTSVVSAFVPDANER